MVSHDKIVPENVSAIPVEASSSLKRPSSSSTSQRANSRWKILSRALLNRHELDDSNEMHQVIRYPSYGFLQVQKMSEEVEFERRWYKVTSTACHTINLKIGSLRKKFSKTTLRGFNNTGNVCIWPSEECLARVCLEKYHDLIDGKQIIELGCGMSGLAGLILAKACHPKSVWLTDGNKTSIENVKKILEQNQCEGDIQARHLLWENVEDEHNDLLGRFDMVISADCLFFDEFRPHLKDCIQKLLCEKGIAVIMSPRRNNTLDDFVRLCSNNFHVTVYENYSEAISRRRQELESDDRFKADTDYPILVQLEKKVLAE